MYAHHIDVNVNPETVILDNDTLSFVLTIKYDDKRFDGKKTSLTVYALSDGQAEELSQIELTPALSTRPIRQTVETRDRINSIGVKFKNQDTPSIESEILPIAVVQDRR
jgi:hypothetical protein